VVRTSGLRVGRPSPDGEHYLRRRATMSSMEESATLEDPIVDPGRAAYLGQNRRPQFVDRRR
jgi:hypothetical protein